MKFEPDYKNIVDASLNHPAKRLPLYEHGFASNVIEAIMDFEVAALFCGGLEDKTEGYRRICRFAVQRGWVERYGKRIGNFGGVEMNIMTLNTPGEVKSYVRNLPDRIGTGHGGIAIGTGNQVSSYTKPENFIAMTEVVREWRGDA